MNTNTEQHFRGACRYKDKTKATIEIGKVETFEEARQAMLTEQKNCVSALVLVPHTAVTLDKEYA